MQNFLEQRNILDLFQSFPVRYIHPDRASEWMPDLPVETSQNLMKCARLETRLSAYIIQRYGLEPLTAPSHDIDLYIALLDQTMLRQVIGIAGAVWHGKSLRSLISSAALSKLLGGIDLAAYRIALTLTHLAPADDPVDAATPPLTHDVIWSAGKNCFEAWLLDLPAPFRDRIALKFADPLEFDEPPPHFTSQGPAILRAIGREMLNI